MPKHGDSTGLIHFNEIIGNGPIVWDDDEPKPKKYFTQPTSEQPEDEAARITRQLATAVAKSSAKRQQTPQAQTGARYFTVPKRG